MLDAHTESFTYICTYIEDNILTAPKVERLTMIRERYLQYMLAHYPYPYTSNEKYKTYKLKDKLVKHFRARLRFWQPTTKSKLVYGADIGEGQAIEFASELASSDEKRLEEAAMIIGRHSDLSKRLSAEIPWPPSNTWAQLFKANDVVS